MTKKYPQFLFNILWTDEALVSSAGEVNLHNMHNLSRLKSHWMQKVQHQDRGTIDI